MPTKTDELRDFHGFLGQKINSDVNASPEEILDEWRETNPDAEASAADLAAIREALDDVSNGAMGMPFEQFDREFRARHNLPAKP